MILFPAPSSTLTDSYLTLDGLPLQIEEVGVAWLVERVTGWDMGAGVETSFSNRPGAHGMYDGPTYRRARVIGVEGVCTATGRALAEQTAQTLAAVMADGEAGTFARWSPLGVRSARVRLSDAPQATWISPVAFRFLLQFTAPDHRKYGEAQSLTTGLAGGGGGLVFPLGSVFDFGAAGSPGQVTLTNAGTAPTQTRHTVTGPLAAGFQISHAETGRRLVYPAPVTADVVIDCAEGTVTSGGQDRTGLLTVDEFFTVDAGAVGTFQFSTLGSETSTSPARMTATLSPAYH